MFYLITKYFITTYLVKLLYDDNYVEIIIDIVLP